MEIWWISDKYKVPSRHGTPTDAQELQIFLKIHNADIRNSRAMKSHIKILNFITFDTKHPAGKVHGSAAIIIETNIKHHEIGKYQCDYY